MSMACCARMYRSACWYSARYWVHVCQTKDLTHKAMTTCSAITDHTGDLASTWHAGMHGKPGHVPALGTHLQQQQLSRAIPCSQQLPSRLLPAAGAPQAQPQHQAQQPGAHGSSQQAGAAAAGHAGPPSCAQQGRLPVLGHSHAGPEWRALPGGLPPGCHAAAAAAAAYLHMCQFKEALCAPKSDHACVSNVWGSGLQESLHLGCMPGIGRLGKGRAAQCHGSLLGAGES